MPEPTHIQRYTQLAADGRPFVAVTLVDAHGSTPSDAGSKMIVTPEGLEHGTVGGGKIEARAIGEAQRLMRDRVRTAFVDWSLKQDVGMTCGGRVRLFFETVNVADWSVVVFGAGHVARALARLLVELPCRVTCIDPRAEWLAKLPESVATVCTDDRPAEAEALPEDAFVLCMTQGHATDRPVLQRIFETHRRFPFLGVIGSAAKAATLRRELRDAGIDDRDIDFRCPVGLPIGTNHPGEIAVSIAAQLLEVRDQAETRMGVEGQEPSTTA